jgi:hypothetical protein
VFIFFFLISSGGLGWLLCIFVCLQIATQISQQKAKTQIDRNKKINKNQRLGRKRLGYLKNKKNKPRME